MWNAFLVRGARNKVIALGLTGVFCFGILWERSAWASPKRLPPRSPHVHLQSTEMSIDFDLSDGIEISGIRDLVTGNVFLNRNRSLFELAPDANAPSCPGFGIPLSSNSGLVIDSVTKSPPRSLVVNAHVARLRDLHVILTVDLPPTSNVATLKLDFYSTGSAAICLRAVFPKIIGLNVPASNWIGAVPVEVGGIAPLSSGHTLGMPFNQIALGVGLPTSMNPIEIATIYDPGQVVFFHHLPLQRAGTGGVFFSDIDGNPDEGVPSLQFTLSPNEVDGFWVGQIPPSGGGVRTANLALGVYHSGDWHQAVDYWLGTHASRIRTANPPTPGWLRDAAAIYTFAGGGAGGIYIDPALPGGSAFPAPSFADRLKDDPNCITECRSSFLNLPRLLDEAEDFGTNVVYIWDYWEKAQDPAPPYFNKGDYIPRADLGGERAFIDGIAAIHDRGGKIILYLEPFIAYQFSQVGMLHGAEWEAWDYNGPMLMKDPYAPGLLGGIPIGGYYKMVGADPRWRTHLILICARLIQFYGADGIFLDSGGWQLNWPVKSGPDGTFLSSLDYTLGFFQLVDELRSVVGPEKVILGETTSGPVAGHWDGGLSADFSFNRQYSGGKILGSPQRYGLAGVRVFSNGENLAELNQMYAAGYGLALCCNFDAPDNFLFQNKDYVRRLVEIRKAHSNALMDGAQTYQPVARNFDATINSDIAAYFYHGTVEDVITVVNTGDNVYDGTLLLSSAEAGTSVWSDLLNGTTIQSHDRSLPLPLGSALGPGQLLILSRQTVR